MSNNYKLKFFDPYVDNSSVVLEAGGKIDGTPFASKYVLPKVQSKRHRAGPSYLYIGGGDIQTISRIKRGGGVAERMHINTEIILRQIAARLRMPLVHELHAYTSLSHGLFDKRGYERVDHQKRRKVFSARAEPRVLSKKKELAIKHLIGPKRYKKTKPRR